MNPHERLEELAEKHLCPGMYPVACSSGTAALHLACEVLGRDRYDDEGVIVPDFAMIACARAISLTNLIPVFADVTPNGLLDPERAEHEYTRHPRGERDVGIMAVHTYGRCCNMNKIHEVARGERGEFLFVIEDIAEAHGVVPHKETHAACWSFYKNKIVAGEEGGLVAFKEKDHALLAKKLRCLGFTEEHDFTHVAHGHNYRLADSLAEIIMNQTGNRWGCIQEIQNNISQRDEVQGFYDTACPEEWQTKARDSVWVYDIRIPGLTYDRQTKIVQYLRSNGVDARHGFKPLSRQEEYKHGLERIPVQQHPMNPVTLQLSQEVIYLPVHPIMSRELCRAAMNRLKTIEVLTR